MSNKSGEYRFKILVVDDNDEGQLDSLKEVLEMQSYSVVTAENEESAWVEYERFQPHLVLLDVHLGPNAEFGGLKILESIRIYDEETVIVLMTGKYMKGPLREIVEERGFEIGRQGIDFVTNDIPPRALLARIKQRLQEGWPEIAARMVVCETIIVDTDTHEIWVRQNDGWETRHLEPKEFNVLIKLVKNKGKIVIREDLWVFFEDAEEPDRALRGCVTRLRGKLKPYADIENVRSEGYRLLDCL